MISVSLRGRRDYLFPSQTVKDGNEKYYDIAFPTTAELRKEISDAVIAKYNETLQSQPQSNADGASQPADDDDPFSGVAGWE